MRRVKRPCLLNADPVGCLSYCKSSSGSAALFLQDCSLEYLDPFAVALFDLRVYSYGIADMKLRYILF